MAMIYAGIDEAGYGPVMGPLVVARSAFSPGSFPGSFELTSDGAAPCCLWQAMKAGVCRTAAESRKTGKLAVNDSKKLHTKAAGLRYLEAACLGFGQLAESAGAKSQAACVGQWLESAGRHESLLPWYAASEEHPWDALPVAVTAGELAVQVNVLRQCCEQAGVAVLEPPAPAVVFEDVFNRMAAATRSKAALSFSFVAKHLDHIWRQCGEGRPAFVAVDRQSGRMRYRELLSDALPGAAMTVLEETEQRSAYRLEQPPRVMTVAFEVGAEEKHLPVALASMTAKYARELMMARLNAWFIQRIDGLQPTAGYATDGNRFLREVQPHLARLGVDMRVLRRGV